MLTAPVRITADIRRLCRKIGVLDEPVFVDVSPRPDSGIDDCFVDVNRQVGEHGGSIQHGWTIWEWPGIAVEGEFHAVWRKPMGHLLDVTYKRDGEIRILFAPDNKKVFGNRRIPNIRMAVGRNPRIQQWIELNEKFDRLMTRQYKDVAFGSEIVIRGEAFDVKEQADLLAVELAHSREARRAAGLIA